MNEPEGAVDMSWFKVDDAFHSSRKVAKLGLAAVGLWTLCGSWCGQQNNGGFVPKPIALAFAGHRRNIRALVDAGLWDPVEGGWQMHDWDHYNPSVEEVKAHREANAERARRYRASRVTNGVTSRVTNSVSHTTPDPTRIGSSSTDSPGNAREAANARSMAAGLALTGSKPEDAYRETIQSYPRQERAIRDELGMKP